MRSATTSSSTSPAAFRRSGPPDLAAERARWLVDAVDELVGLLRSPSKLEDRARRRSESWPVPETWPSFVIEGRALMRAARVLLPSWTEETETAWRHAWLLVSAVVEDEALSPFAIPALSPRP